MEKRNNEGEHNVRYPSFALNRNEKVEQHIRKKTYNPML